MLTECPSCLTVFRVTPAILKMGRGQVRCGKCRTQFDAVECLLEEDESQLVADAASQSGASSASSPANQSNQTATTKQDTPASSRAAFQSTPQPPKETIPEHVFTPLSEHIEIRADDLESDESESETSDEDWLGSKTAETSEEDASAEYQNEEESADKEPESQSDFDSDSEPETDSNSDFETDADANDGDTDTDTDTENIDDSQSVDVIETDAEPEPAARRRWNRSARSQRTSIDDELHALTQTSAPTEQRRTLWIALSVALVVGLVAQMVHHNRDGLLRNPKWGATVSRIYGILGMQITPHWDLHAYELQQWGVVSDASAKDALRVRASVTNNATYSQPYPHIKLALEDRWGGLVAMREFAPEEYLLDAAAANRMMSPRQRANAEVVIVDPGADAVGFQLHACLNFDQSLVCSDEIPAQTAQ